MGEQITVTMRVEEVDERGCGWPIAGGVYWQLLLGPDGIPIDTYLLDPPVPVSRILGEDAPPPSAQGVTPFVHNGVVHLLDIVGEGYYPDVEGYWYGEVHHNGVSRRLPKQLSGTNPLTGKPYSWADIDDRSLLILAHRKALIDQSVYNQYQEHYDGENLWVCPTQSREHPNAVCVDFWHFDLGFDNKVLTGSPPDIISKQVGSNIYYGYATPDHLVDAPHTLAAFARVPATRIAVYEDQEAGTHSRSIEAVRDVKLPIDLVRAIKHHEIPTTEHNEGDVWDHNPTDLRPGDVLARSEDGPEETSEDEGFRW